MPTTRKVSETLKSFFMLQKMKFKILCDKRNIHRFDAKMGLSRIQRKKIEQTHDDIILIPDPFVLLNF